MSSSMIVLLFIFCILLLLEREHKNLFINPITSKIFFQYP